MLVIVMCVVLCGLDEVCNKIIFAENRAKFFKEKFGNIIVLTMGEAV